MQNITAEQYTGDGSIAFGDSEPVNFRDFYKVASFEALHASMMKCIKGVLWKDTPAHFFSEQFGRNAAP